MKCNAETAEARKNGVATRNGFATIALARRLLYKAILSQGAPLDGAGSSIMPSRRTALASLAAAPALLLARRAAGAALPALPESHLVYLTPLKSNGEESRCQGEVWFAHQGGSLFVVTAADAWRAKAVAQGLKRARLWVGDYGVWTRARGAYRNAPEFMATAALETNAEVQASVLRQMAGKYAEDDWETWGPRFRSGLNDGARVMIRYALDA